MPAPSDKVDVVLVDGNGRRSVVKVDAGLAGRSAFAGSSPAIGDCVFERVAMATAYDPAVFVAVRGASANV